MFFLFRIKVRLNILMHRSIYPIQGVNQPPPFPTSQAQTRILYPSKKIENLSIVPQANTGRIVKEDVRENGSKSFLCERFVWKLKLFTNRKIIIDFSLRSPKNFRLAFIISLRKLQSLPRNLPNKCFLLLNVTF